MGLSAKVAAGRVFRFQMPEPDIHRGQLEIVCATESSGPEKKYAWIQADTPRFYTEPHQIRNDFCDGPSLQIFWRRPVEDRSRRTRGPVPRHGTTADFVSSAAIGPYRALRINSPD